MNTQRFESFEDAFVNIINHIYYNADGIFIGRNNQKMYENLGLSYKVEDASTYQFVSASTGRITYDYANDFYNWMIKGCNDEMTLEFATKYPQISKFVDKPKSLDLPDNFNVLYGPRILEQLPKIINELQQNENSRRAVISILQSSDLDLLNDERLAHLEYPCCDSSTLMIRYGKLHQHLHMRSNNMGNVAKLDMYLWGRLQCDLAATLSVEIGSFSCSIASAHIFDTDVEYFKQLNIII